MIEVKPLRKILGKSLAHVKNWHGFFIIIFITILSILNILRTTSLPPFLKGTITMLYILNLVKPSFIYKAFTFVLLGRLV